METTHINDYPLDINAFELSIDTILAQVSSSVELDYRDAGEIVRRMVSFKNCTDPIVSWVAELQGNFRDLLGQLYDAGQYKVVTRLTVLWISILPSITPYL